MELIERIKGLADKGILTEIVSLAGDERELCKLLANAIGAEAGVTVNGIEADLSHGTEALEVKVDPPRFYSGFSQALALKFISNFKEVGVLHVVDFPSERYLEYLGIMAKNLGIPAVIITKKGEVHVIEG